MRFNPKSLLSDDRGLSTVEYIIVVALLAISAMTAWQLFGDAIIGAAEGGAETLETMEPAGSGAAGGAGDSSEGPGAGGAAGGPGGESAGGGGGGGGSGGGGGGGGGGSVSAGGTGAAPSEGGSGVVGGGSASSMGGGTVITSGGGGEDGEGGDSEGEERAAGIYVAPGTDEEGFDPFGFGAFMSVFFAFAIPLMIMLKKARGSGGGE